MSQPADDKHGSAMPTELSDPVATKGRRWNWFLDLAEPGFGQFVTWLLLLFTVFLALTPIEFSEGQRSSLPATVFSWLPEILLRDPTFFTAVRVMLIGAALMWAMRIAVPVSCWATTILFGLMWSLRMENLTNGAHIFNVTNMFLLIHAMWFQFYGVDMKRAADEGKFWQTPVYPRWAFLLSIFYLGWFHTLAGVTKIVTTGFGWGTGVSLQLWTEIFGETDSPFAQVILYDTRLTAWLQTGALVIECVSILAVFHWTLRYAVGVGLIGFYIGVLTTFVTFGFHFNAILVALFLLPVDWLIGLKFYPQSTERSEFYDTPIGDR